MSDISGVKALVFDVFGTCVDWRTSLIDDFTKWSAKRGINADWTALVDGWRAVYMASMDEVRKHPERGYMILDTLHRQSLEKLVAQFAIKGLTEADLHYLNDGLASPARLARHRVRPDAAEEEIHHLAALQRQRRAADQHGQIRRDAVGSDPLGRIVRALQARSRNLSRRGKLLCLQPGEVMMVAAHNNDLKAAQQTGLKTAFVARPTEYGPHQKYDFDATGDWDVVAADFNGIAERMGC